MTAYSAHHQTQPTITISTKLHIYHNSPVPQIPKPSIAWHETTSRRMKVRYYLHLDVMFPLLWIDIPFVDNIEDEKREYVSGVHNYRCAKDMRGT
ncbi:hypothetical protein CDAR_549861 [Caerostris darwini]|uniref:Uncharacterized protein n=1 Tax=Caerostris darwini TaxID=1538125 RepID=A0AAV4Q2X8_9ARAC|nr:hypothetical protein CDAR_549861 [Caerostris darwini]